MICSQCKTENGYVRLETKDWVCRKCGKISPIVIKEKIEPQPDIRIVDEKKEAQADLAKDDPYIPKED